MTILVIPHSDAGASNRIFMNHFKSIAFAYLATPTLRVSSAELCSLFFPGEVAATGLRRAFHDETPLA
jgi:hypothetical protein